MAPGITQPIRILIVDDHAVIRRGLVQILSPEPDLQIVGEAGDGQEAVAKALELKPDIVILDIFMPRVSGLEALVILKEKVPGTRVLMLTVSEQEKDLVTALDRGADGYLLKSAPITEVAPAVRNTAAGQALPSSALTEHLIHELRRKSDNYNKLSPREKEILRLVGSGLANPEIAARLVITESTVRTHLQRSMEKLNLQNRSQVIAYASRMLLDNQY